MLTLAIAPLLAAAAPAFAPPLEAPVSYLFSDVREDRGRILRFDIRRRITFRTTPDGLTADVETVSIDEAADRAGAMFTAMMRGMIGRHVIFRVDEAGKVVDVVDLDAQWTAYVDGIAQVLGKGDAGTAKAATVAQIVAARRAAPREQRIATLAEMLQPTIGGPAHAGGTRAITLPGRGHDGSALSLTGTERTGVASDGALTLERSARGAVNGLATSLTLSRQVDAATGLVLDSVERLATETPAGLSTITRRVARIS